MSMVFIEEQLRLPKRKRIRAVFLNGEKVLAFAADEARGLVGFYPKKNGVIELRKDRKAAKKMWVRGDVVCMLPFGWGQDFPLKLPQYVHSR